MTRIVDLQRRLVEVGRIRLGEKRVSQNGKQYPAKLTEFRLTSRDRHRLDAAAALYGGEVKPWDGHEREYELQTKVDALEIAVVPGQAISQSFELWGQERPKSRGDDRPNPVVCLRRCDGQTEMLTDGPCICAGEEEQQCKPTTRLSVVLTRVPGIGVWRVDTHGWNAAHEIIATVELLETLIASGRPIRARLRLDKRTQQTRSGTRKFVVPVVDIDHSLDQVLEVVQGAPAPRQIVDGSAPALPPAPPATFEPVPMEALAEGPQPSIAEQMGQLAPETDPGRKNLAEPIRPTGATLRPRGPITDDDDETEGAAVDDTAVVPEAVEAPTPAAEGHPAAPSEPPPPDDGEESGGLTRPQRVAIWCRDAGLDDDGRHRFLEAFSNGEYKSATKVPPDHMVPLHDELERLKNKQIRIGERDGKLLLLDARFGWPADGGPPSDPEQPALGDDVAVDADVEWSHGRWTKELDKYTGIAQGRALRKARELAPTLGLPVPLALGDVQGRLRAAVIAWCEESGRK